MSSNIRIEAYSAVKAAVRAYSKDPTDSNAVLVEQAWQLVRTLDAVSVWRHKPLPLVEPAALPKFHPISACSTIDSITTTAAAIMS
jgi:hypothetical protein